MLFSQAESSVFKKNLVQGKDMSFVMEEMSILPDAAPRPWFSAGCGILGGLNQIIHSLSPIA